MKLNRYLLASLATVALATSAASSARAQAPTVITTAPYTITKPGVYQLQADLFYAGNKSITNDAIITVNSGNVTLDFNGHYISGPSGQPGTTLYGVYAKEKGNLIIKNGTVAFCYLGIYLNGSGMTDSLNINQRLTNLLVSYCYGGGVDLYQVRNSNIIDCSVSFTGGSTYAEDVYGIIILGGVGNNVINNNVTSVTSTGSNGAVGIYGEAGTFIVGNRVSTCKAGIVNGVYKDNLLYSCTTPYYGGNDGGNNKSF